MALTLEQFRAKYSKPGGETATPGAINQAPIDVKDVRRGAVGQITRGLGAGFKQGGTSALRGIVTAADAIVPDRFEKLQGNVDARFDWLDRQDQNIQNKLVEKLGYDGANKFATQASAALGQGVGQIGAAIANPALGFAVVTSQALGAGQSAFTKAYDGAISRGKTPEEAKKIARINGYITGAVNMAELIPVGKVAGLATDVMKKPASMALKKLAPRFGMNALTEVGTEAGQDFASSLTEKLTYDEDAKPVADALHSALVSIPTAILFGSVGEAGNFKKIERAKETISQIMIEQGATPEQAQVLADKMVEQRMLYGDGQQFEETPKELQESYDSAIGYLRAQNQAIAQNPDYSIDTAKSDAAYQIIEAYDSYQQKANEDTIASEEAVGQEMVGTTQKLVNFVKGKLNGQSAIDKWREDSGKKFEELEKQIQAEKKRAERNEKARIRRATKKTEKIKEQIKEQEAIIKYEEKKERQRARYAQLKEEREAFLNEPYIAEGDLPVINTGATPRSSEKSIQVGASPDGTPRQIPGYTYEPVDDYGAMTDKMLRLMEEQNKILEETVKEVETKKEEKKETKADGKEETKSNEDTKSKEGETKTKEKAEQKVEEKKENKEVSKTEVAKKELEKLEAELNKIFEKTETTLPDFKEVKESLEESSELRDVDTKPLVPQKASGTTSLKIVGGGEVKVSGLATTTQLKAIEEGLTSGDITLSTLNPTERMVLEDQMYLADEFIKADPEYARDVAYGRQNAPVNLQASVVYAQYVKKMIAEDNGTEVANLLSAPILNQATAAGQFVAGFALLNKNEDAVAIAKEIQEGREKLAQKKLPKGVDLAQEKKRIIEETKTEIAKEVEKELSTKEQIFNVLDKDSC